ncbi:gamma-glutamyl-gamma-aminobutyrate hydrolase family protein [bacterium]|nr:gamma-glutamyl-gamma-aminobutyrate hydrolase family protein [bacterium]
MRVLIVNCVDYTRHNYPESHPGNWFARAAGGDPSRFTVWHAALEAHPPAGTYRGVIISGSPASAYDPEPWIARLADFIRQVVEKDAPLLGVCFGHQLIAQTLGGRVERNPRGRELGTLPVFLNEAGRADPLFAGMPAKFPCYHGHRDHVAAAPPGAECLAASALTPIQAFRLGRRIRAIQFHPEFTNDIVTFILQRDRQALEKEDISDRQVLAGLCDSPVARRILSNFESRFLQNGALEIPS